MNNKQELYNLNYDIRKIEDKKSVLIKEIRNDIIKKYSEELIALNKNGLLNDENLANLTLETMLNKLIDEVSGIDSKFL